MFKLPEVYVHFCYDRNRSNTGWTSSGVPNNISSLVNMIWVSVSYYPLMSIPP